MRRFTHIRIRVVSGVATGIASMLGASVARAQDTPVSLAPTPNAPPPANVPDASGPQIVVTLTSGEVFKGVVRALEPQHIVILHPVLGDVRIPRTGVASSVPALDQILAPPPQPNPAPPPTPPPAPPAAPAAAPKPAFVPPTNPFEAIFAEDEKDFIDGWNRVFEFGLNGTTDASESQNYRMIGNLSRQTRKMTTVARLSYVYGENNDQRTQDRGEASIRNDWALGNTPWSFWASGKAEFDSLDTYDARVSLATGVGYNFVQEEKFKLTGRLGVGGYRDIKGVDNNLIPQTGIFALSMDYAFAKDANLYANTEYNPSGRSWDWDNFRAVSRAGVQFVVDPELKASLRLGVEHRHDSEAPAARNNALDYSVTLGFAF